MIDDQTHHHRGGVPTARDQSAVRPRLGAFGIGVERLRIVARRERADLVLGHAHAAELGRASDRVVLEKTGHAARYGTLAPASRARLPCAALSARCSSFFRPRAGETKTYGLGISGVRC